MKPMIYFLLFLVTMSNFALAQAPIGFDIRGRDCSGGLGLCSTHIEAGISNKTTVQKTGENTFILTVTKELLTEAEQTSLAGKPFSALQPGASTAFTQGGDLVFSEEVLQAMGINPKYNLLKAGTYPMTIEEDVVKVTLTLSEL